MAVSNGIGETKAEENSKRSDLSITLNASDFTEDSFTKIEEEIYKYKFTLSELYRHSLLFYKKGLHFFVACFCWSQS